MPATTAAASPAIPNPASREPAAAQFVALAQKDGPSAVQSVGFTDAVVNALGDKKSPPRA